MKDCQECSASSLERPIDGFCCERELCGPCEREHQKRHAAEPDFDFNEWCEETFDESDLFFLVPEYRRRF